MSIQVKISKPTELEAWDAYVSNHSQASVYHQSGWCRAIQQSYGHPVYNLTAVKIGPNKSTIVGVLPLVHIKHFMFGNNLFSLPFADLGGILADDAEIEKALLTKAIEIATEHAIPTIELRQAYPLTEPVLSSDTEYKYDANTSQETAKVRMLLDMPDSSEQLMNSFKSKLRSQIRRPLKHGLISKVGGIELLDDFYIVFAENMRGLGSPVHSKRFIENLLIELPGSARLFIIYNNNTPVACSLVLGHGRILANPWASSLRKYSRLSPNMLLYWNMLEYACDNGFTTFDFGRSTPEEGTYKFKKQWGAKKQPLCWQVFSNHPENNNASATDKSKFEMAMRVWKKLPVGVTKVIGPALRKNIGL
jgi:serine/alanine adding enzyme